MCNEYFYSLESSEHSFSRDYNVRITDKFYHIRSQKSTEKHCGGRSPMASGHTYNTIIKRFNICNALI